MEPMFSLKDIQGWLILVLVLAFPLAVWCKNVQFGKPMISYADVFWIGITLVGVVVIRKVFGYSS